MLTVENLRCERGGRTLFSNLEFSLEGGMALHVHGDNGSGKSSLLRMLALLAQPQTGRIFWDGEDVSVYRDSYIESLLYIGHKAGVNLQQTVKQNLDWYAALHAIKPVYKEKTQFDKVMQVLGLSGLEHSAAKKLSAGQRRRIVLARLFLEQKKIWILDEPFVSLDLQTSALLEQRMAQHIDNQGIVIFSSHQPVSLNASKVQSLTLEMQEELVHD